MTRTILLCMAALLFLDLCRSAGGIDARSAKDKPYQAWGSHWWLLGLYCIHGNSKLCNNTQKRFLKRMRGSIVVILVLCLKAWYQSISRSSSITKVLKGTIASFKATIGVGGIGSGYRTCGCSRYFSVVTQPLNVNVAEISGMENDLLEKIISLNYNEIKNCWWVP